MIIKPYATVSCFVMDRSNALRVKYLRFDDLYQNFNVKVSQNGWITWKYDTSVLENYILNFQVAIEAMKGGASTSLHFYLVEYEPATGISEGGYPTESTPFVRVASVPLTHRTILHTASIYQVQGGVVYNLEMKLEPQKSVSLPIYLQKTRWFRVFVSYEPPAACTSNDNVLHGFGVPVLDFQEGLLSRSSYITERLPFIQMEVVRIASPLDITDLAALQIPSQGDVAKAKHEAIVQSHINLISDLSDTESEISKAVIELVGDTKGTTVEEVRLALIEDLADNTTDFSVAVLDLIGSIKDFVIDPNKDTVLVGEVSYFSITLFNGLSISTLRAVSSDVNKATVSINVNTNKIEVTAVAPGTAVVTVSSTDIEKTQDLDIKVVLEKPDFSLVTTSVEIPVGNSSIIGIRFSGDLEESSMRAVSDNLSVASCILEGNTLNIKGESAGSTKIKVSSTAISKIQDVDVTVTPSSATFKATNIVDKLTSFNMMWVSLDTSTGELTLDTPNGSNILVAGEVLEVDSASKVVNVRYLGKTPVGNNRRLIVDKGFSPAKGDPVILKEGKGSSTGYSVPNCIYNRKELDYYSVAVLITDVNISTLEKYKVS